MVVTMKDVRKGTRVVLRSGWTAVVLDNLTNRQTRMCEVHGDYTEMGSVYSSEIVEAFINGNWEFVQHSPKTLAIAKERAVWGF